MSPPPDFAERVFEARTASARRIWFAGAALFTVAAAITTILVMRQHEPRPPIASQQPPVLIPAPVPSVAPGPMPSVAPVPTPTPTPAPAVHPTHRGTVAILGIEPLAREDVEVARDLTEALRARAKVGTGAYQLGAGTDVELLDEKLLNNCDTEAPACMAAIGQQLGVDAMMFGKIELRGGEYHVTLKLLDVNKRMLSRSLTRTIASADASGVALQSSAKQMYFDLAGPVLTELR